MISKFALTALLALAVSGPVQEAAAQDAVGGAIVGGVLGGVVGGALGGGRGAAAGAIIGAGTGAAIAAQGEPRKHTITLNAVETSSPSPAEFSTAKESEAIRPHSAHMPDRLPPTHHLPPKP